MVLTLKKLGNSVGVVLPKETLVKLRVGVGDSLHVIETPDGIKLTPYDPELGAEMDAARDVMKRRRSVLRELAK